MFMHLESTISVKPNKCTYIIGQRCASTYTSNNRYLLNRHKAQHKNTCISTTYVWPQGIIKM